MEEEGYNIKSLKKNFEITKIKNKPENEVQRNATFSF